MKMKEPETILETKSIAVQAFPLNHGIETFGFRFAEKEPPFNVHKDAIVRYGLSLTEIGTLKRGEDVLREDGSVIPAAEAAYKPFVPRSYAYCSDTAPFPEEAAWLPMPVCRSCSSAIILRATMRYARTRLSAAAFSRKLSPHLTATVTIFDFFFLT